MISHKKLPEKKYIDDAAFISEKIGKLAEWALIEEVITTPKPGLVDNYSNGAHKDMTMLTFRKSAHALTPYFIKISEIAYCHANNPKECFSMIKEIGKSAETAMYDATGGVNTHKGAIFSLGIFCAAAAAVYKNNDGIITRKALFEMEQRMVCDSLKAELNQIKKNTGYATHGEAVLCRYGAEGIRGEALSGYSSIQQISLPVLDEGLRNGHEWNRIKLQCLLVLMSHVEDSNILSRRNDQILRNVQKLSQKFVNAGGAYREDALQLLQLMDRLFIEENISPGGCADLLAVTVFICKLTEHQAVISVR